jgi:hypothetical protein
MATKRSIGLRVMSFPGWQTCTLTLAGIGIAITATATYAQEPIELDKFALLSSPLKPMKPACDPWWHPTTERLLLPVLEIEIEDAKSGSGRQGRRSRR